MPSEGLYERYINFYTDFNLAEISKYDKAERLAYQESLKDYRDYYNTIASAEERGREEEKLSMAAKMKSMGMPIEQIVAITGLTAEEISSL